MIFTPKKIHMCQFFDRFCFARTGLLKLKNLAHAKHYLALTTLILCSVCSHASDNVFPYKSCFEASAKKFNLDPNFLAAVASVESSFDPLAESSSGALGLMQIKWPQTAIELGVTKKSDLFNPCLNIDAGASYLANLFSKFKSKLFALAAYYQGPTKIRKEDNIPRHSVFYIEKVLREEVLIAESSELSRSGKCELANLQALSQKTHHPKTRLKEAHLWFTQNHIFCSTPELLRMRNRLPEIMGTADASGELRLLINNAIQEKSATKK